MEINKAVNELRELRRMSEEISAAIETIQDAIKNEMSARGVSELSGLDYKITWKAIVSSRIDTSAIKRELPEIAARYTKTSETRRFIVA